MGNTPSSEAQARPLRKPAHRLSKPKTGNHASAGMLSPNGLSNSTSRFSVARSSTQVLPLSPTTSTAPPPTATSPVPPPKDAEDAVTRTPSIQSVSDKESRRMSLFRSKSSQGPPGRGAQPERRNSSIGPQPRSKTLPVRAMSLTHDSAGNAYYVMPTRERRPSSHSRTSWNYDMSSYEAKRLLNLVEEPGFEQQSGLPDSHSIAAGLDSEQRSSIPSQSESTPISRANSDLSLYTPVRRRSIIRTPGVATRTPSAPPTQSRRTYRHSLPPTPSLSRQQSFESTRSGVLSMPPPPRTFEPDLIPRVVTPSEEDYKAVGAFKLGSLRIVNGQPSPSPISPALVRERKQGKGEQNVSRGDYFSEARGRGHSAAAVLAPGSGHIASQAIVPQPPVPQPPVMANEQSNSPFRGFRGKKNAAEKAAKAQSLKVPAAPPQLLTEIGVSPFDFEDRPFSPELQITSKHTAQEDELFEDDPQAEFAPAEVIDVRLDPSAKKEPETNLLAQANPAKVSRPDSGLGSTSTPSSEYSHRALSKADSGYSSNVSLRSFHASKSRVSEDNPRHSLEQQQSPTSPTGRTGQLGGPLSASSSLSSKGGSPSDVYGASQAPPVPPKDYPPAASAPARASPASPVLSVGMSFRRKSFTSASRFQDERAGSPSLSHRSRHSPSPINSIRSTVTGPKSPDMPRSPMSARSESSTSALSIGSGSYRPSKLQRLLSGSKRMSNGPPMVHATHTIDKTVPGIPAEVEGKLHEHTGMFPITTKRLALRPQLSKDTLKTILSVGSAELNLDGVIAVPSVSPVPEAGGEDATKSPRRHHFSHVPSSLAHAASHVIPRKPVARKPLPARQYTAREDEKRAGSRLLGTETETVLPIEAQLATYDSINDSLGYNAYDAAFQAMAGANGARSPTSPPGNRAMSMTASIERTPPVRPVLIKNKSATSLREPPSPSLPTPLLPRDPATVKSKTGPPVSMVTRSRPASLRVPQPIRPKSSVSRRPSRETIHSYPPSSQEQRALDSAQAAPAPMLHQRRSLPSMQYHPPLPRRVTAPNWDVRTDHDTSQSAGSSRRNSLSSNSSAAPPDGGSISRPTSARPHMGRPDYAPPLRHRASYDGYSHHYQYQGPPNPPQMYNSLPQMHNFGPSSAPKIPPPGARPQYQRRDSAAVEPPFDPTTQAWNDQGGRYPSHTPPTPKSGHGRTRSMGNRSGFQPVNNPPYRVLHSYNSPAYRNVPIWG